MKITSLFISLFFTINLYSSLVDDGLSYEKEGNYEKAVKLYEKSCENKNALGCFRLANSS